MVKEKIAISLTKGVLTQVDSRIDGILVRSRSQAIEVLIKKAMEIRSINTAVLMLRKKHHKIALSKFKNSILINSQIKFFRSFGIEKIYIITQPGDSLEYIRKIEGNIEVIETNEEGNGDALKHLKGKMKEDFIVMSGDTYNNFDLKKMIEKHLSKNVIATMGLMSHEKPKKYGSVVVEGDMVINFQEKSKLSHIINAGIYIFRPDIFDFMSDCTSLEYDLFPKLAKMRQLAGHFTMGEYHHVSESFSQLA